MAGRLKCVGKRYGKNNEIIAYDMMNEAGAVQTFDRNMVKEAMLKGTIEVINLQIASDGRLVDKAISLEKESTRDEPLDKVVLQAYEASYRNLMRGGNIGFMKKGNESTFYDSMDKIFKKAKLDKKFDALKIAQGFENYIREKYNCMPLKLSVKLNKGDCRQYIVYGLRDAYVSVASFYFDEGEHNPEIYLNENNYTIQGRSLNPALPQPICKVGINDEKDQSIVRIKGNPSDFPKDAVYMIMEKGSSIDGDLKNAFLALALCIGLPKYKRAKYIVTNENTPAQSNNTRTAKSNNTRTAQNITTGKQGWLKAISIIAVLLRPRRRDRIRLFNLLFKK